MKKYCILPFSNIRIDASNGKQRYRPCCHYYPTPPLDSIDGYLASDEIANLQNQLLTQDELPGGCAICKQTELHGNETSIRLLHKTEKVYTGFDIETLEIFPGNVCNLRCIMCNPKDSSALGQEYKKLGWMENQSGTYEDDRILEDLHRFPNLKSVNLIGGEFFLAKKNLEILDFLIEKNVGARIVTNATIITDEHLAKLKQISNLNIQISIDGIGEIYEFIRYPANWAQVNLNITRLKKELPNASIHFNAVIQPLNIQYIDQLIDYTNRKMCVLTLTPIMYPTWLTWEILLPDEIQLIIDVVKDKVSKMHVTDAQQKEVNGLIDIMLHTTSNPNERIMFINRVSQLMESRKIPKESIEAAFGNLTTLAEEIIKKVNYE